MHEQFTGELEAVVWIWLTHDHEPGRRAKTMSIRSSKAASTDTSRW